MPEIPKPRKATELKTPSIRAMTILPVVALCVLTVLAECERLWWRAYLVAQFRVEIAVFAFVLSVYLISKNRSDKPLIIPIVLLLFNIRHLTPYYLPAAKPSTSHSSTHTLMLINLNTNNHEYNDVTKYIHEVNPNTVMISELTPEWLNYFTAHLKDYPHSITAARLDTYGIGVYSKVPLSDGKIEYFGKSGHPSIVAKLTSFETPITLLHTHIQGPVKERFFDWHRDQFEAMTPRVRQLPHPLIVSGDMNSNAWTYLLKDFLLTMKLSDSQWGRGIRFTWPAPFYWRHWPFPMLTIDHVFASDDVVILSRKLGKPIHSDHYPVIVEIANTRPSNN